MTELDLQSLTDFTSSTPSNFLQVQFFSSFVGLLVHSLDILLGKLTIHFTFTEPSMLYFICLLSNYSENDNANLLNFLKSVYVKIFLLLRIKFFKKIW